MLSKSAPLLDAATAALSEVFTSTEASEPEMEAARPCTLACSAALKRRAARARFCPGPPAHRPSMIVAYSAASGRPLVSTTSSSTCNCTPFCALHCTAWHDHAAVLRMPSHFHCHPGCPLCICRLAHMLLNISACAAIRAHIISSQKYSWRKRASKEAVSSMAGMQSNAVYCEYMAGLNQSTCSAQSGFPARWYAVARDVSVRASGRHRPSFMAA